MTTLVSVVLLYTAQLTEGRIQLTGTHCRVTAELKRRTHLSLY